MTEATLQLCNSNNSAMFLARENNKSKTYLQLMHGVALCMQIIWYFVYLFVCLMVFNATFNNQGYKKIRLIRSLKKFIFRYQNLVEIYSVSAETIINDAFSYSENVVKMYKDKEAKKNVKNIFLSMCDVKVCLTFTTLNMVLLWRLFYLFCSCI
jgi:hypothetical protein